MWKLVCLVAVLWSEAWTADLETLYEWSTLQWDAPFGYPGLDRFDPTRTPPTSFEVSWDRVILAVPRIFRGTPATLAWIPRRGGASPVLRAYPDWGWHSAAASGDPGNCTGLISVFRMRVDRCDRLWVLDSGVLDSLDTFTVACPPRILVFDLATDTLVRSIALPSEVLRRNTLLTNLVLDERGDCDKTMVYIADSVAPGLVVYNSERDTTWRISHPNMFPDPDFGTYSVAGERFTLMDGILGMAITGGRLYFQPFASDRLFSVPTQVLDSGPNPGDDGDLPVSLVGHKSSQAAGMAVGPLDGALYFSPVSETAVASWIPGSPEHRVVAVDPERLQFALDMRAAVRDGGTIWVLSTRFQKIMRRTLNPQEINFRLLRVLDPLTNANNSNLFIFKK